MKKINALNDLDQKETENEVNAYFENLEFNRSSWSYNRLAGLTTDLFKGKIESGVIYVELPFNFLSILNIQNKSDKLCAIWCIKARFCPVNLNAFRMKSYEKNINAKKATNIILGNGT